MVAPMFFFPGCRCCGCSECLGGITEATVTAVVTPKTTCGACNTLNDTLTLTLVDDPFDAVKFSAVCGVNFSGMFPDCILQYGDTMTVLEEQALGANCLDPAAYFAILDAKCYDRESWNCSGVGMTGRYLIVCKLTTSSYGPDTAEYVRCTNTKPVVGDVHVLDFSCRSTILQHCNWPASIEVEITG